ncbi:MAG TPA: DUF1326 domain-containing protein [Micromonosporaceae bacterium]
MSWRLQGSYFENCNCHLVCPCTVSAATMHADEERCRVTFLYHIEDGEIDGVDVGGLTVGLLCDAPGLMADGGWRVGMFMDSAANDQQAEKLQQVFGGQLGGPPAALAALVGEVVGLERGPIEYADDGRSHRVKMGDLLDIEIEDYVSPGSDQVATLNGMTITPNPTVTIATATRARIRAFGLDLDNQGRNAHSAPFQWAA